MHLVLFIAGCIILSCEVHGALLDSLHVAHSWTHGVAREMTLIGGALWQEGEMKLGTQGVSFLNRHDLVILVF